MKGVITLIFTMLVLTSFNLNSQTVWTGTKKTFTKADNADWTLETNQDRITATVWITRKDNEGLLNIFSESNYSKPVSPADTEWAFGTTANYASLTYGAWREITRNSPNGDHENLPNQDMVLHLITEDIYIDLKFLSWTSNDNGGGFSYERSTDQALGINDEKLNSLNIYPNPSSDYVFLNDSYRGEEVILLDILGKNVLTVKVAQNNSIDIRKLVKGIYFLRAKDNAVARFIKK
jgi:hypothetical protein